MRLTIAILIVTLMQVSAGTYAQRVTMERKQVKLQTVFKEIRKQTGYDFIYQDQLLDNAKPVNVKFNNIPFEEALKLLFEKQPLTYSINGKVVIIKEREPSLLDKLSTVISSIVRDLTVKGRVVDENGKALPNASIQVKGKPTIYKSNENGEFTIYNVPEDGVLIVRYVGYKQLEIPIKGAVIPLEIKLNTATGELEEVKVTYSTGYQDIPKERSAGSFAQPDKAMLDNRIATNIISKLEGITSGLLFKANAQAGNGSMLQIRGQSTINANENPLIVVDNFPYDGDINNINPNDVASITVLKDAAAASIWGARAGNGVIVITTKKGSYNQPLQLNVTANTTFGKRPDLHYGRNFLNSSDFIDLEYDLFAKGFYNADLLNTTTYPIISPVVSLLAKERAGTISQVEATAQIDKMRGYDIRNDREKYFYRGALNQQYLFSVSGGNSNMNYGFSGGYDRTLAEELGKDNRLTLNTTAAFKPFKNLEFSAGINYTKWMDSSTGNPRQIAPGSGKGSIYPYARLVDENGSPQVVVKGYNPDFINAAESKGLLNWQYIPLNELGLTKNEDNNADIRIRAGLKYTIIDGLSLEGNYQYSKGDNAGKTTYAESSYYVRDLVNRYTNLTTSPITRNIPLGGIISSISDKSYSSNNGRLQLNFNKQFGAHAIDFIAGAEMREVLTVLHRDFPVYGYNPQNDAIKYVNFTTPYPVYPGGSLITIPGSMDIQHTTNRYRSYFGNGSYTFSSRYILNLSARIDQANLFGVKTNNKQVPLWSVGGKWNLSDEKFYHISWLPVLKARVTYGFSGNLLNDGSAYTTWLLSSQANPLYPFNSLSIKTAGNPALRWEKIGMLNMGVDFSTLKNRLNGSVEYYIKNGKDMIGNEPIPSSTGFVQALTNYAKIRGRGIDIHINSINVSSTDFSWSSSALFSYTTDKITKYTGTALGGGIGILEGKPVDAMFSFKWAGLNPVNGNPQGLDSLGNVSENYTSLTGYPTKNRVFNGRKSPSVFGGFRNTFSYRQLSMSFNLSYKFGYYFNRGSVNYSELITGWNGHIDYTSRWQKPGDELHTTVPSFPTLPLDIKRDEFYKGSEALVTKGDHIRLQDINLGYTLNKNSYKSLPFRSIQLLMQLNNLGVLWKSNKYGIDPDEYVPEYLTPKSIAFSLKLVL